MRKGQRKAAGAVIGALVCAILSGCAGSVPEKTSSVQTETVVEEKEAAKEQGKGAGTEEAGREKKADAGAEVQKEPEEPSENSLPDGIYQAEFDTDSSMFHVNEACEGKGTLTVADGKMTIHISLTSKNILNLYPGLAEDAQKEGAELLQPAEDTVTYSDGTSETVHGFDVPVPALDEEFDLALIGKKGKWYDHRVMVSSPEKMSGQEKKTTEEAPEAKLEEGTYTIEVMLEGGSGKAELLSPAVLMVSEGQITARIQWNSPNYDYMIVDGETFYPVNTEGNSVFEIPAETFDAPVTVIGDTVAMSRPHEIEYTLTFYSDTIRPES